MDETASGFQTPVPSLQDRILINDEVIAIVDDDPSIRGPLKEYFQAHGLAVIDTDNAAHLMYLLETKNIALVLLDINLPDQDGQAILPKIIEKYKDIAVIMLTGIADLNVAMDCIRKGADDYLAKPIKPSEILFVVKKNLEKRRLILDNRRYLKDIEKANFRLQLMHQLSTKMNTAYLSTMELDEILLAVLVGITANEGLRFNRAFLAMFDADGQVLSGKQAIGTTCRAEAGRIWAELKEKNMDLLDIVHDLQETCTENSDCTRIIRTLRIPIEDTHHVLIEAALQRRSLQVINGKTDVPVAPELINLLGEDSFVIVPLYSPRHSFGVIIADNFVTHQPIHDSHIKALELFASQASLAIEQSQLYADQHRQIIALENLNAELDRSKDLLIKEERYSALGHMAAQMVHVVKNPLTSIGGIARIMARKITKPEWQKYLQVLIKETDRLESTLDDLFDFVSDPELHLEEADLYPLIERTIMLVSGNLDKGDINLVVKLQGSSPTILLDIGQVRLMLLHLLKNSVEAMPNGGELDISAIQQDGQVMITITDTGKGITDHHLEMAKDPFFTTKTYGTGLGLSLVERVVAAHGGSFSLNRRDVGLEATVTLPLRSTY